jgi:hypothetical protein
MSRIASPLLSWRCPFDPLSLMVKIPKLIIDAFHKTKYILP